VELLTDSVWRAGDVSPRVLCLPYDSHHHDRHWRRL